MLSILHRIPILLIFCFTYVTSIQNQFSLEVIESTKSFHTTWVSNTYSKAQEVIGCDNHGKKLVASGYENNTSTYWDAYWKYCNKRLVHMICGTSKKNDNQIIVPNSHICDGHIIAFANYQICAMNEENLKALKGCTIISIGSNNIWDFEIEAFNKTNCDIHTFDPRVNERHGGIVGGKIIVPPDISNRTYLHNYALGVRGVLYDDILEISKVGKEKPLSILKLDCEGCELPVLSSLNKRKLMHLLPLQITMEIHPHLIPFFIQNGGLGHHLETFKVLIDAGYTVFYTAPGDGGCEVSFVKFQN